MFSFNQNLSHLSPEQRIKNISMASLILIGETKLIHRKKLIDMLFLTNLIALYETDFSPLNEEYIIGNNGNTLTPLGFDRAISNLIWKEVVIQKQNTYEENSKKITFIFYESLDSDLSVTKLNMGIWLSYLDRVLNYFSKQGFWDENKKEFVEFQNNLTLPLLKYTCPYSPEDPYYSKHISHFKLKSKLIEQSAILFLKERQLIFSN